MISIKQMLWQGYNRSILGDAPWHQYQIYRLEDGQWKVVHREISASVRDARCLRLMGRLAWHTVAEIGTMPNAIGKSSLDAKRHQND